MTITATEFKKNIGKYLDIAVNEDVFITKNGKSVAKLTDPKQDRIGSCEVFVWNTSGGYAHRVIQEGTFKPL